MILNIEEKRILIELARKSIEHAVLKKNKFQAPAKWQIPKFNNKSASFVTLKINDDLRGCIGSVQPRQNLIADITENAVSSALKDPRFPPVTHEELEMITIEISILHDFELIENRGRENLLKIIKPNIHGLIIEENFRRATFLPSVWDALPTPEIFLGKLLLKAGLPGSYWSEKIKITLYKTESFT